jgi:hypothetical protein
MGSVPSLTRDGEQLACRLGDSCEGRAIVELREEMRGGFATMATGMAQITALLTEISGPERDSN